ncbi:hypothetical protein Hdeb2414_s0007g00245881 [Helianthus debilis subsp. tardiflorus]
MIRAFTFETFHTIPKSHFKIQIHSSFPFHSLFDFGSRSALSLPLPCIHHKPLLHGCSRHLLSDG